MQTAHVLLHKKAPPLWFVTNGDVTVGPVTTNLLVRGVLHERVPADCMVRERKWSTWRSVERIREVAALRRAQASGGDVMIEPARWREVPAAPSPFEAFEQRLHRANDPSDVLRECLMEAMRTTGAWVGAIHRRGAPRSGFVTVCTSGPKSTRRVGRKIPFDDPAALLAFEGRSLCEEPDPDAPSWTVRNRLGAFPACSGVAMTPLVCADRLYALVELGRPDHAFRASDFEKIVAITRIAEGRLGVVRNAGQPLTIG